MAIDDAIAARYPHQTEVGNSIRDGTISLCKNVIKAGLLDANAEQRLCSTDHAVFWQQFSEILVADQLLRSGHTVIHRDEGPDFLIEAECGRTWVEVITPEPKGIPGDWTNHVVGNVVNLPHKELLLRWTAAIKEKAEKLLGSVDRKSGQRMPGYLDNGIVKPDDRYVIAVNSRLLRGFGGAFPELYGISQFPFAVEATLAVGPMQIEIDRDSLKSKEAVHQYRARIRKFCGAEVPADTFFDPKFAPVSAIWAMDVDELLVIGEQRPMATVLNPLASNPLPLIFLPAQSEYEARLDGDYFELRRSDGKLTTTK